MSAHVLLNLLSKLSLFIMVSIILIYLSDLLSMYASNP